MTLAFSPIKAEARAVDARQIAINSASKSAPRGSYRRYVKRVFETALIILALPIVVPVIALCMLLISLDGHKPIYTQMRIGAGGKTFRIWKLRTMVHNADAMLQEHLEKNPMAKLEWDATQKLKQDPRITTLGRFLRKSSLDELPQLYNVLNGTMSLVGPRPMMPCQEDSYTGVAYYRLRPGITGLWQVSDRNECDFVERVRFDNEYDRTVSLGTDLRILIKTVGVVLRATGY